MSVQRPVAATLPALVADAVARLPGGVGTKSDIIANLTASPFVRPGITFDSKELVNMINGYAEIMFFLYKKMFDSINLILNFSLSLFLSFYLFLSFSCSFFPSLTGILDRGALSDDPFVRYSPSDRLWIYLWRNKSTRGARTLSSLDSSYLTSVQELLSTLQSPPAQQ